MDFNVFVENIVDLLQRRMGKNYKIRVTNVTKNNDTQLTGVVIAEEAENVSPTIYLEGLYEEYLEGAAIEKLAEKIITFYREQVTKLNLDMEFFQDFERVREQIYYKLVSFDKNQKLLEDVPYFRWHDLAIVFYYVLRDEQVGRASITIHRHHMEMWGQSVDSIYRTAQNNMKKGMPEMMISMSDMLLELTGNALPDEEGAQMYVLTNREKLYGAAVLLYSEKLKRLAQRIGCDVLILPSSVHEVILIPDDRRRGYDNYLKMVDEVNRTQLEPEDVLSYKLYRYSRKKAQIEEIFA